MRRAPAKETEFRIVFLMLFAREKYPVDEQDHPGAQARWNAANQHAECHTRCYSHSLCCSRGHRATGMRAASNRSPLYTLVSIVRPAKPSWSCVRPLQRLGRRCMRSDISSRSSMRLSLVHRYSTKRGQHVRDERRSFFSRSSWCRLWTSHSFSLVR